MWCCCGPYFDPSQYYIHPELDDVYCFYKTERIESIDGVNTFLQVNSKYFKTNIDTIKRPKMPKKEYLEKYCQNVGGQWVYVGVTKCGPEYFKV